MTLLPEDETERGIALAIYGIVGGMFLFGGCISVVQIHQPDTGEKIGQVVKLNKTGWFFKTWEAELIRGGLTDGSGTAGTKSFEFTVPNDTMAQEVERLMRDQTEVTIKYHCPLIVWQIRTEGRYFLTEIAPLKR